MQRRGDERAELVEPDRCGQHGAADEGDPHPDLELVEDPEAVEVAAPQPDDAAVGLPQDVEDRAPEGIGDRDGHRVRQRGPAQPPAQLPQVLHQRHAPVDGARGGAGHG